MNFNAPELSGICNAAYLNQISLLTLKNYFIFN